MEYDPKDIFKKLLKKYIYVLSFPTDKVKEDDINKVFLVIVEALNKTSSKYCYDFTILPNADFPQDDNKISDIFISYNPDYLIDEKSLVNIVRYELMQSMK